MSVNIKTREQEVSEYRLDSDGDIDAGVTYSTCSKVKKLQDSKIWEKTSNKTPSDAVRIIEDFYDSEHSYGVSRGFTREIESRLGYKTEYFKAFDLFQDCLTYKKKLSTTHRFAGWCKSSIADYALYVLVSEGYEITPDIVDNKVKKNSDKQYKKATKVLKSIDPENWDEVALGNLYSGGNVESIIVSIDPYEFQTASENCGWSSCFDIVGQYHTAVWAYFGTPHVVVVKALNSKGKAVGRFWMIADAKDKWIGIGRIYGYIGDSLIEEIATEMAESLGFTLNSESFHNKCEPFSLGYDSDNTYFDTMYGIYLGQHTKFEDTSLNMEGGLDAEGDIPNRGRFAGICCHDCGDVHYEDDMTYIEDGDYYVCDYCLSDYAFCERRSGCYPRDNMIYIQDRSFWVHEDYCDEYIEINGDFYEDLPDDYVVCSHFGEVIHIDNAVFIQDCEDYVCDCYLDEYYCIDGKYYKDIPEGFGYCEHTEEYYPEDELLYVADKDFWVHQDYIDDYTEEEEEEVA